jgi:anti-sigma factor RsiW
LDCNQAQSLLSAYADGEIDARGSLEIEEHLKTCNRCARALDSVHQIKHVVSSAPVYRAPAQLRRSIRAATKTPVRRPISFVTAGAFATCVFVALTVGWMIGRRSVVEDPTAGILASHVRALMSEHLADVISTDQHTVKPWFNGKIDYSPPVNDLAPQGFPLTGGRLEYMDGKRVAVLVYARRKHVIDVYVVPSAKQITETSNAINGFNMRHWTKSGFEYWAVSDVNNRDLGEFCDLLEVANA